MANITIYLPDALAGRVRAADIPISRTCQDALRGALAAREAPWRPPARPKPAADDTHPPARPSTAPR